MVEVALEITVAPRLVLPVTARLVEVALPELKLLAFKFVMVEVVMVVVTKELVPVKVLLLAR